MPKFVYIIRHGETDWNKEKKFQGHQDIALNDKGKNQAKALAGILEGTLPFDRIVSSDLQRALETARIINDGFASPIILEPAFREMDFGSWEGLDISAIEKSWPQELQTWFDTGRLKIPEGENEEELFARAWHSFEHWANKDDYQKMAVVCHGATCSVLVCGILGRPPQEMSRYMIGNTDYYKVAVLAPGKYQLMDDKASRV